MSHRVLYIIGPTKNPVKIGVTDRLKTRLAVLQIGCPDELIVHHEVKLPWQYAMSIEQACHRELKHLNRRGEWFNIHAGEALKEVLRISSAMRMEAAEDALRRGDILKELTIDYLVSDWADRAIAHYRECLDRSQKDLVEQMNNVILKKSGIAGLSIFQMVIVKRVKLHVVTHRVPSDLAKAKKALAEALDALGNFYGSQREENLLAEMSRFAV